MTTGTEIINYEAQLAAMAQVEARKERPSGSNISTRAGVLSYNGQPVPGNKLQGIIIASTHANLYYDQPYNPDAPVNPACWAYSVDGENMAPAPEVANPVSESCDGCPNNAWGSDPKGGRGKACQNRRVLAMIPANIAPGDIPTAEIAVLKLPVTSTKMFQMYVQKCAALHARPLLGMVTEVGTVPDQKKQFMITLTDVKPVDNAMIPGLLARAPSALEVIQPAYEANPEPAPAPAAATEGKKKKF